MVTPSEDIAMAMGTESAEHQYLKLSRGLAWQRDEVTLSLQSGSSGMGEKSLPSSPMQAISPSPIWMQKANRSEITEAISVAPYLVWWYASSAGSTMPFSSISLRSSSVRGYVLS